MTLQLFEFERVRDLSPGMLAFEQQRESNGQFGPSDGSTPAHEAGSDNKNSDAIQLSGGPFVYADSRIGESQAIQDELLGHLDQSTGEYNLPTESVDLTNAIAGQDTVSQSRVDEIRAGTKTSDNEPVIAVKLGDQHDPIYAIVDGNHRAVEALQRGETRIDAKVLDLTNRTAEGKQISEKLDYYSARMLAFEQEREANGQFGPGSGGKDDAKPSQDPVTGIEVPAGVQLDTYSPSGSPDIVGVSLIKVDDDKRGEGLARTTMERLVAHADENGLILALSPSRDFGSKIGQLTSFYKSLGFKANKGSGRELRVRESMVRYPETPK